MNFRTDTIGNEFFNYLRDEEIRLLNPPSMVLWLVVVISPMADKLRTRRTLPGRVEFERIARFDS